MGRVGVVRLDGVGKGDVGVGWDGMDEVGRGGCDIYHPTPIERIPHSMVVSAAHPLYERIKLWLQHLRLSKHYRLPIAVVHVFTRHPTAYEWVGWGRVPWGRVE